MQSRQPYTKDDFDHSPFIVFYEVTRACDLICKHCRASAQPECHPEELDGARARMLIEQLASFPKPPMLVFTGGDPAKRADIFDLIRHGVACGLEVSLTPSATPLVTPEFVAGLAKAGLHRLAVSLDGADAATHDAFRGVEGTFDRALRIIRDARAVNLPIQVNTTITRYNAHQVDAMADLLAELGIVLWSVFLLIPVGRGLAEQRIAADEYEQVFEQLWKHAQRGRFGVKTTEAHHYRRFVLQHKGNPQHVPGPDGSPVQRAPIGINDGKGVMFISHTGEIFPSGFMPLLCGRFPQESVVDVYQKSENFRNLRDPDKFGGKCGVCEYRHVCGGSRARAYAVSGDPLGPEPDCNYIPRNWIEMESAAAPEA